MQRFGCGTCHAIEGLAAPQGAVGPSLKGFASRAEIAGVLTNRPDNLIRWLRHPQAVRPGSGMPEQGVDEGAARDMAAYLYTSRQRP